MHNFTNIYESVNHEHKTESKFNYLKSTDPNVTERRVKNVEGKGGERISGIKNRKTEIFNIYILDSFENYCSV